MTIAIQFFLKSKALKQLKVRCSDLWKQRIYRRSHLLSQGVEAMLSKGQSVLISWETGNPCRVGEQATKEEVPQRRKANHETRIFFRQWRDVRCWSCCIPFPVSLPQPCFAFLADCAKTIHCQASKDKTLKTPNRDKACFWVFPDRDLSDSFSRWKGQTSIEMVIVHSAESFLAKVHDAARIWLVGSNI